MNKTMTIDHQKLHDFITLIQGYLSLYDTAHLGYKKTKKNDVIGPSIAQQLSEIAVLSLFAFCASFAV